MMIPFVSSTDQCKYVARSAYTIVSARSTTAMSRTGSRNVCTPSLGRPNTCLKLHLHPPWHSTLGRCMMWPGARQCPKKIVVVMEIGDPWQSKESRVGIRRTRRESRRAAHRSFLGCGRFYIMPTTIIRAVPVFFLRRKSIVHYLGCSNWMVRITGFSNKSCSAFACCNRVRYIVPLKKTMSRTDFHHIM